MNPGGRRVVFLMGPTAAGKTDVAVALARRLPVELISVDSAMVYRRMDIGTGKPDPEVLARAPHRLVDIREPHEPYSAAQFRADAARAVTQIQAAGRLPVLVGGTGLYFRALREGLSALPVADPGVRREIEAEAVAVGWDELHRRLAALDPAAARRIHPNDPQRIQRALEVHRLTGRTLSELRERGPDRALRCAITAVVLEPGSREALHRRIAARFRGMLARGLVDEVSGLRADPRIHRDLPAMRSVGYRQVWEHLEGEVGREAMAERAITATRRLARRQLTWLRREPDAVRVDCLAADRVARVESLVVGSGSLAIRGIGENRL